MANRISDARFHILYFPKSSGERFSRNSASFSFFSRSRSVIFVPKSTFRDFSITWSSTKIGAPARRAMAIASLGRASTTMASPFEQQVNICEEGVVPEIVDLHPRHLGLQDLEDFVQEVMGHGA